MYAVITFHDTGPCPEYPNVVCPMHTFGPFRTVEEARRFIASLIPGQAPHLASLMDPALALIDGFAVPPAR